MSILFGCVGTKRLTFLVNWWDVKPEEPNCSPLKYDEVAGLKTMNAQELVQFRKKVWLIIMMVAIINNIIVHFSMIKRIYLMGYASTLFNAFTISLYSLTKKSNP